MMINISYGEIVSSLNIIHTRSSMFILHKYVYRWQLIYSLHVRITARLYKLSKTICNITAIPHIVITLNSANTLNIFIEIIIDC